MTSHGALGQKPSSKRLTKALLYPRSFEQSVRTFLHDHGGTAGDQCLDGLFIRMGLLGCPRKLVNGEQMGYNLLINGIYLGYDPLTNHLLTSWDIQVVPF